MLKKHKKLLYFPFLPHISSNKFCSDPRSVILNQYSYLISIFVVNSIRCKSASDIKKVWMNEEEFCGWYFYTWMSWKQWLTMTSLIGVCRWERVSFMNQPYSIIYSDLPDLKNKEKRQHGVMNLTLKRGQMCGYILSSIWEPCVIFWLTQHSCNSKRHPLMLIQTLYFPTILCVCIKSRGTRQWRGVRLSGE